MATKLRVEIEDATQKGVAAVQKSIDQLETQIKRVNKELGSNANRGTSGSDPELARQAAVQKSLEETLKILANAEKQLRQAFSQEDVLKRLRDSIESIGGPTDFVDEQIAKLGESMESIRFQADDAAVAYKKAFKDIGDSLDPAKAAAFQRAFEDVQRSISGGITKAAVKADIAQNKQLQREYAATEQDRVENVRRANATLKSIRDQELAAVKRRNQEEIKARSEAIDRIRAKMAANTSDFDPANQAGTTDASAERAVAAGEKRRAEAAKKRLDTLNRIRDQELAAIEQRKRAEIKADEEVARQRVARIRAKMSTNFDQFDSANQVGVTDASAERAVAAGQKLRDSEVSASQSNALKDLQEESRLLDRLATKYKNLQREKAGFEAKATGARVGVGNKTVELEAVQKQIEANEKSQEIARRNAATSQAAADKLKVLKGTHQSLTEQAKLLNVAIDELSNSEVTASHQAEELQRQMSETRREFNDTGAALSELIRKTEELGVESEKTARARKNAGSAVQSVQNTDAADVLTGGAVNSTQQNAEISRNTKLIKENEAAERSHAQTLQASAKSAASITQRIQTELILRQNNVASIRANIEALKSQQAAGVNVTSELTQQHAALERQERLVDKLSGRFGVLRTELVGSEQDLRQYVTQLRASGESSPEVLRLVRALEELAIASDKIDGKEMAQEQKTAERAFQSSQKAVEAYTKSVEELQNRLSAQNARVSGLVSESSSIATQIAELRRYKEELEGTRDQTDETRRKAKQYGVQLKDLEEKLEAVRREAEQHQSLAREYSREAQAALNDASAHGVLDAQKEKLNNTQGRLGNRLRRNDLGIEAARVRETAVRYNIFRRSILGVADAGKRNSKVLIDAAQAWLLNTRASNEFFNSVQRGDKGGAGPASFGAIIAIGAAAAMAGALQASKKALEELAITGDKAAKEELAELNKTLDGTVATLKQYGSAILKGAERTGVFSTVLGYLSDSAEEATKLLRDSFASDQLGLGLTTQLFKTMQKEVTGIVYLLADTTGENIFSEYFRDLFLFAEESSRAHEKLTAQRVRANLIADNIGRTEKAVADAQKKAADEALKSDAKRIQSLREITERMRELRATLSSTEDEEERRKIELEMISLVERRAEIQEASDNRRLDVAKRVLEIERQIQEKLRPKDELPGASPNGPTATEAVRSLDRQIQFADQTGADSTARDLRQQKAKVLAEAEQRVVDQLNEQRAELQRIAPEEEARKKRLQEANTELEANQRSIEGQAAAWDAAARAQRKQLEGLREEQRSLELIHAQLEARNKALEEGRTQDAALHEAVGRRREAAHTEKYGDVRLQDEVQQDIDRKIGDVTDASRGGGSALLEEEKRLLKEIAELERDATKATDEEIKKRDEAVQRTTQQLAEVRQQRKQLEDEEKQAAQRRAIDLEKQRQAAADILDLTQRTAQQRFQDGSRIDDLQARKALAGTSGSKKSSRALDKAISEQIKDEVAEAKNEYKRLVAEIKKAEDAGEGATDETQRMRKELEKALEVYRILRQEADRFNANVVTEAQKEAADQFSKRISAIEQFLSQSKEATGQNAVSQLQGRVDDPTVDREIKARRKGEFEAERDRLLGEAGFDENNLRKTKGGEIIAANRGDRKEVRDLIDQARKNTFGKKRTAEELAGERSSVRNDISQRLVDQLEKTGQIDKETAEALRKELDVQNETISSQLALKKSIDDLNKSLSGEGETDEINSELEQLKKEQAAELAATWLPKPSDGVPPGFGGGGFFSVPPPSFEADKLSFDGDVEGPRPDSVGSPEQAAELAATGEKVLFADDLPGFDGGNGQGGKLVFDGDVEGPRQDSFNQPQRAPQTGTSQGGDDGGGLADGFGGFAAGASQLAESSGALGSAIATGLQTLGGTLAAVSADQMAVSNMVAQLALQISQVVQANLDLGEDARGRGMAAGRRP